jgi:hypothetical protein
VKRKFSLPWFEREVKRLDPQIDKKDDAFKAGVLLLAALQEGANMQRLAKFTGYDKGFVRAHVKRARDNGIFVGGRVHCDWFEEEFGGVAFWVDVLVAQGLLARSK